ncbi:GNAT family N-acetyltransferase [Nocardioides marmoriginsengisoli]|uniref:GNAT family N-acetyltransferase n=1 Tax=Nocardioides marmoriginsengisoli TaxID=661483 RepID=A0A3N0CRG2_9ACTN|nr:GNAT family N-acetyltransferase [Nocardioides marmoriginsengisoli]
MVSPGPDADRTQTRPGVVRVLGPADLPAALAVLEADPVTNVFADYRSRITQLDQRWLGGQMWGYIEDSALVSLCHVGANLVPVQAGENACAAFAERALSQRRLSSTIVGPAESVRWLWRDLADAWGPARDERWDQPHLVISTPPLVAADPGVRRTTPEEVDTLYPACVAMYTEEVGVSPEADGGRNLYRARVTQLVNKGWSFSRIEGGKVVFKAEIACASPLACQVQGVYVDPEHRGRGVGASGMAAVVAYALAEIAPAVSLYVNAHNAPARAAYAKVGFSQTATFSTLMF